MNRNNLNKLVAAALFTAITCMATMVIRVPSLGMNGYVNIGDSAVLLCAWVIGGPLGFLAAGLGSGLADLLAGYAVYVPGTFLIKFLMAVSAYALMHLLKEFRVPKAARYAASAAVAEIVMVAGYFVFEAYVLGYGAGAVPAILSNTFQGITNLCISLALILALDKSKALDLLKKVGE